MKVSQVSTVNDTGADIREFDSYFLALVNEGTDLPEEIADLFDVEIIEVEDGRRAIIRWAEDSE